MIDYVTTLPTGSCYRLYRQDVPDHREEMADTIRDQVLKMQYYNPFGHSTNEAAAVLATMSASSSCHCVPARFPAKSTAPYKLRATVPTRGNGRQRARYIVYTQC